MNFKTKWNRNEYLIEINEFLIDINEFLIVNTLDRMVIVFV